MSLATLAGIPSQLESGDTVLFTESFTDYPVGVWTLALILNNGVAAATSFDATTSGTSFLFTLTATQTAALAAGNYTFAMYATSGVQRATAKTGVLSVLANLTATATPSVAQTMVAALDGALLKLSSGTNATVDINGQQYTKKNLKELTDARIYWQAQVLREQAAANAARGIASNGRILTVFASPYVTGF